MLQIKSNYTKTFHIHKVSIDGITLPVDAIMAGLIPDSIVALGNN